MVARHENPDQGPQHRRNAFDHKRHLPADGVDQEPRNGGHPCDGDGIAENQNGVGPRALSAREPVGQKNQHRGEDETLRDAQQQPIRDQQPVIADDSGESGEDSPADERKKDQPGGAAAHRIRGCRNLEEKVAEKEDRAEKGRAGLGDMQRLRQACCRAKAEVGAAQVGKAVGDENHRHQVKPAAAQVRLNSRCIL